jgi:uncharacterized membrane protein
MSEITAFGWFHTVIGVLALLSGFYTLARYKVIRFSQPTGRAYLLLTLVAAASALGIYEHGGFGVAHGLAVLTIVAVLVGATAEKTGIFGALSRYIQAASYSATLLFHMIPATTDGLMRLPADAPFVSDIEDPLLRGFYWSFLAAYIVGVALQIVWLRKTGK